MTSVQGGPIRPVKVITSSDLQENGGVYILGTKTAIKVHGFTTAQRAIQGGRSIPVYIVTDDDINNGLFRLEKGVGALPVGDMDDLNVTRAVQGRSAIPVYAVNDWPPFVPEIILFDEFTDTNGTLLDAHTIAPTNTPGVSWIISNNWDIQGNQANTTNFTALAFCRVGVSDVTVTCTIDPSNNNARDGIILRCVESGGVPDASDYWFMRYSGVNEAVQIIERIADVDTVRASSPLSRAIKGAPYDISCTVVGSSLSVSVEDVTVTYTSSTHSTEPYFGMRGQSPVGSKFNDFKVVTAQ